MAEAWSPSRSFTRLRMSASFSENAEGSFRENRVNSGVFLHHDEVRRHNFFNGKLLQSAHIFSVDAQLGEELLRVAHRDIAINHLDSRAAFDNRAVEKPFGRGHGQQRLHLASAAGLAKDGHRVWITSKLRDVRTHPFQRLNDVQHADVAGVRKVRAEFAQIRKAQNIEAMIDGNDDHVAAPREISAVIIGRRSRTGGEASPVTPEHYGAFRATVASKAHGGRPNVEHQAIFTLGWQVLARDCQRACWRRRGSWVTLGSAMSVSENIANVAPVSRFHRRHEAIRASGARSVRNSFEDFDPVVVDTANFAKGSFGDDKLHILRTQFMQEDAARNGES